MDLSRNTLYPVQKARYEELVRFEKEKSNSILGLLKLPPELRTRIYQDIIPNSARISPAYRISSTDIALMQTCRALRKEIIPIFYGTCTFSFDIRTASNFRLAQRWVDGLSPDAAATLRKVYISGEVFCHCKVQAAKDRERLIAWIDADRPEKYHVENSCKACYAMSRDEQGFHRMLWKLLRRLQMGLEMQQVRKEDLEGILQILRPISDFDLRLQ